MVEVRQEQLQRAYSKIVDDGKDLHISGQPGIGKTVFLDNLQSRLSDEYKSREKTVSSHHDPDDLESDLLHLARDAAKQRDLRPNQVTGLSAGVLSFLSLGAEKDDREEDRHKLEQLTADWSGTPLVLVLDDIHKIADEEETVRDVISDFSSLLGENVNLVTAGQISLSRTVPVEEIHLNLYTRDETQRFLEATFDDVTTDCVQEIHTAVEGHPLYLRTLAEYTDDLDDLRLPRDDVYSRIEEYYIESLPPETEQFLRQVAPLPELDEKTCNGIIDDLSITEIDRILRMLSQRVIVQQVNRTNDGTKIYKIHEGFRRFLIQKHENEEAVHRNAFQYHIREIADKVPDGGKEAWESSIPHSFYVNYHLNEIYSDEVTPDHFITELDRMDLSYPLRGIVVFYTSVGIMPKEAPDIWRLEFSTLSDWLYETVEHEPVADFLHQAVDCFLSQFHDDNPKQLEDIQIEGSLDDLPMESQPITELDISEQHAQRLRNSVDYTLKFFLVEEPYRSKTHREHALKLLDTYGLSLDVVLAFRSQIKAILSDSDIGDEFDEVTEQYQESIGSELENSLASSLDFYELSEQATDLGTEILENFHYRTLLSSGLLEEIAVDGGDVLEDADNPAFATAWYALFIAYFRKNDPDSPVFSEVKSRYIAQLEQRREYEEDLESPMFNAKETAKNLELEEAEPDELQPTD